ncbi:hypothetical protein DFR86_03090 [Acidianus sulfidivorans JP7]|uniref:Uncharacterized protein n=1 Tax=Acidianus sulfidivorans JP7 TaxID=619593 RepID=A0A2U9IKS0_9CREN|nr:hypothetical protein [Acidianus sulfidivorans]AWR96637.1 hypothetical protein DFR86_03090 [Acidianus sulfidivorans JP7]
MTFILNLDSNECSFDPIEAIEYVKREAIFKINKNNPYFKDIADKYNIQIIKEEDDEVYFKVL